jgi:hypothetical protein
MEQTYPSKPNRLANNTRQICRAIDPPGPLHSLLDPSLDSVRLADVDFCREDVAVARAFDFMCYGLERLVLKICNGQFGAEGGEEERGCAADAGGAAGEDDYFVGEVDHSGLDGMWSVEGV